MTEGPVSGMYPPNRLKDQKPRSSREEKAEKKARQEPIVSTPVNRRRRSLFKKTQDFFQSDDFGTVGAYLFYDVTLPAVRNLIFDVIENGAERMLFGDSGRSGRRSSGSRPNFTPYATAGRGGSDRRSERRDISRGSRRTHDFGEIVFRSRADADAVLDRMGDLIEKYGQATVLDLYDLVDIDGDFTDDKWGWTQIRTAGVIAVRDGYLLDLPRTESLAS